MKTNHYVLQIMIRTQDLPNLIADDYQGFTLQEMKAVMQACYHSCPLGDKRKRQTYIDAFVYIRLGMSSVPCEQY